MHPTIRATAFCVFFVAVPALAQGKRVEIFIGGGVAFSGPNIQAAIDEEGGVTVTETGRPIVSPGKLTSRPETFQIRPSEARAIFRLALAATDVETGCNAVADGTFARVTVQDGKRKTDRRCANAAEWPVGPRTKALLDRINKNLPKAWQVR